MMKRLSRASMEKHTINIDDDYDDDYSGIIRSNAIMFVMNDIAYLSTGSNGSVMGTTWGYDIANDVWGVKTGLEGAAREGAIGFSVNNRGYVTTGHSSSSRFDDLWEFFPFAEQSDDDN